MSEGHLPEDLERTVDGLRTAARALADHDLAASGPRPDFADIVARAHRIDPSAVPYGWLDAARRGLPTAPPARRSPRTALYLGLAAALLLALGLARGLASRTPAAPGSLAGRHAGTTPAGGAAPALADDCGASTCPGGQVCNAETCTSGQVCNAETCASGQVCNAGTCAPGPVCKAGTCPPGQVCKAGTGCTPEQAAPGRAAPAERPGRRVRAAEPREDLGERLRRLDDEAEAALRAGDLAGADARYAEIVTLGGSRPEAELAFVDRFGLARARADLAAQRALWRAYLDRFPRGDFAEDARAGLCRSAAARERAACWRDYLARFPGGEHRAEAADAAEATP